MNKDETKAYINKWIGKFVHGGTFKLWINGDLKYDDGNRYIVNVYVNSWISLQGEVSHGITDNGFNLEIKRGKKHSIMIESNLDGKGNLASAIDHQKSVHD